MDCSIDPSVVPGKDKPPAGFFGLWLRWLHQVREVLEVTCGGKEESLMVKTPQIGWLVSEGLQWLKCATLHLLCVLP